MEELFSDNEIDRLELVNIQVDDTYENTKYLPNRLAKLIAPAWESLQKVIKDIHEAGGDFKLTDAYRSNEEQMKAHLDYKLGKKSAYSPPPGNSMHEAGRAIDIAWSYDHLGIKQDKAGDILRKHGWTPIVDSFGDLKKRDVSEEWHWEYRGGLEDIYNKHGYKGMVEYAIKQIDNYPTDKSYNSDNRIVKDVQNLLNDVGIDPGPIDGVYGSKTERAIWEFQKKYTDENPDGRIDYELVVQLISLKNKNDDAPKNDDVRHDVIREIDGLISDLKISSSELSELKEKVMSI